MFKKILIAKFGDNGRQAVAVLPNGLLRAARAGDLDRMERTHV